MCPGHPVHINGGFTGACGHGVVDPSAGWRRTVAVVDPVNIAVGLHLIALGTAQVDPHEPARSAIAVAAVSKHARTVVHGVGIEPEGNGSFGCRQGIRGCLKVVVLAVKPVGAVGLTETICCQLGTVHGAVVGAGVKGHKTVQGFSISADLDTLGGGCHRVQGRRVGGGIHFDPVGVIHFSLGSIIIRIKNHRQVLGVGACVDFVGGVYTPPVLPGVDSDGVVVVNVIGGVMVQRISGQVHRAVDVQIHAVAVIGVHLVVFHLQGEEIVCGTV